jgi:adenylate cyclase
LTWQQDCIYSEKILKYSGDKLKIKKILKGFFVLISITATLTLGNVLGNISLISILSMQPQDFIPAEFINAIESFSKLFFLLMTVIMTTIFIFYSYPVIVAYMRVILGSEKKITSLMKRRAINMPIVFSFLTSLTWIMGSFIFAVYAPQFRETLILTPLSIISTLPSALISLICIYFLLDLIFRFQIAPELFPEGRLREVPGTMHVSVRKKMILLGIAISLYPISYLSTLIYGVFVISEQGVVPVEIIVTLMNNTLLFVLFFIPLGLILILVVARSYEKPLRELESIAENINREDYSKTVDVISNDEIGALGDTVNKMVYGLQDKAIILDEFGRLVDPAVRDYLLSRSEEIEGEIKTVTVLFSDIRSFTSIAEQNSPKDVVNLLNHHFSFMAETITRNNGYIDKFIGDAVMATFGLFDETESEESITVNAMNAVKTCYEIREKFDQFILKLRSINLPEISIGMGVHTGQVLAGKIGSSMRYEYTIIGDAVNIAARVESLCKDFSTDLIVTDNTYQLCKDMVTTLSSSEVEVKGRRDPVKIYTLT